MEQEKQANDYLINDLIFNVSQLNNHLAHELAQLQENKISNISSQIIELAYSTAIMTNVLAGNVSDIDTVIKNSVS